MKKVLIVHFGPGEYSHTQHSVATVKSVIDQFASDEVEIIEEDLAATPPDLFDIHTLPAYIKRNLKKQKISKAEQTKLVNFDRLAQQLLESDVVVLAFPMYNYHLPAAVKAWIDAVTLDGHTFERGFYGADGKVTAKALVLMSTGGVRIDSSKDFVSDYLRHALKYLGIKDILITGVTGTSVRPDKEHLQSELQNQISEQLKDWLIKN